MADPDLSARDADICWRYERCASVIILSNMLRGSSYPCLNLSDVRGQIIRKSAEDGTHLIVRDKNYCFQLFLLATADLGDALQANIPFDDIAGTRCEAVNRFYRFLIGETPAKMPRRCGMRAKYLPMNALLLKRVAALSGEKVCREGERVIVAGKVIALAKRTDAQGRRLPAWQGCQRLADDEIFLVNVNVKDSLDGRYFGPSLKNSIIGLAHPIWTDDVSAGRR